MKKRENYNTSNTSAQFSYEGKPSDELQVQDLKITLAALHKANDTVVVALAKDRDALAAELTTLKDKLSEVQSALDFHMKRAKIEDKISNQVGSFKETFYNQWLTKLKDRLQTASQMDEVSARTWELLLQELIVALLPTSDQATKQERMNDAYAAIKKSKLFYEAWYRENYQDVFKAGLDPLTHYLSHGAHEQRRLGPKAASQKIETGVLTHVLCEPKNLDNVIKNGEVLPHIMLAGAARKNAEDIAKATNAKVSVIVPTYNRATTIIRAVRSALDQTISPHQVIVADDQSTDATLDWLENSFAAEIKREQLIILRCKKGGVCKMRNEALSVATGDVIAYLDSDNFWHPDHLLWAVAALSKDSVYSVYTAANIHHLNENWSRVDSTPYNRAKILAQNFIDLNCFVHCASLYDKHGGFDTNLTRLVDWDYILRLTKDSPPIRIPVATVEYFLDEGALGNITFVSSLQENVIKVQLNHRAEIRQYNIINANLEKKLDAAEAEMRDAANAGNKKPAAPSEPKQNQPVVALAKSPQELVQIMPASAKTESMRYFGGLTLFVVLPEGVAIPKGLPVSRVNARFITIQSDERWFEILPNAKRSEIYKTLPEGNFWYPDLRQPMPTAHQLATLTAATQLTQIDMAVSSYTLELPPKIGVECFRNQVVMRKQAFADFKKGRAQSPKVIGKVLRLPHGPQAGVKLHALSAFMGKPVLFSKDYQYFSFKTPPELPKLRRQPAIEHPLPKIEGKPRILILAQKLAVGGVERNTIEIARQLKDSHQCLYLTLESINSEQGSLCHQAVDACESVLDLAEIGHHALYPALLRHLNAAYAPDNLWICNGSMWLSGHAKLVRDIFSHSGIVDQQVYDVDAGWINHYQKAGIQSFDRFIAINRKIYNKFTQTFSMNPDRVDLIYSAIDAKRFRDARARQNDVRALRDLYGLPQDKQLLVFMGRLVDQKRPLDFLKVALQSQANNKQHFVLVGNGVLAPEVEDFLTQHNLGNVTWIKNVADTTKFWPAVDAYLVMSEYEGLPIALIESISLGVPVLATDVGDIRYVLEKYQAGYVVGKTGDIPGFTHALQEFSPNIASTAAKLQTRGEDIIAFFSAQTISQQFSASFAKSQRQVQNTLKE